MNCACSWPPNLIFSDFMTEELNPFKISQEQLGKENERKVEAPRQQPAAPVKQTAVQQQQKQVQPAAGQDRQEKAVRVQPVLQEARIT